MKLFCHKGEPALVYVRGSEPLAFSLESRLGTVLLPTVYLCWMYPDVALAPPFRTSADVLPRLQQGADLMMPGVLYNGQLTQTTFGHFDAGSGATVMVRGAVVAVGTAALSSTDLYMAGGHGKAVIVAHVVGDLLWGMGSKAMPPYAVLDGAAPSGNTPSPSVSRAVVEPHPPAAIQPQFYSSSAPPLPQKQPISYSSVTSGNSSGAYSGAIATVLVRKASGGCTWSNTPSSEDCSPSQERESLVVVTPSSVEESLNQGIEDLQVLDQQPSAASPQVLTPEAMDSLLLHCLLKAVQQSKGKLPLPLLTSNFYRLHVLPACPDGVQLDIKKSSYKKVTKFLKVIEEKGILQVTEHPKGIENITSVNFEHPDVLSFRYNKRETTVKEEGGGGTPAFAPPTMEEVYQVSGDTIAFYRACGKPKGDVLSRMEVRQIVTAYIKTKKLTNPKTNLVDIDPVLHGAIVAPKEGLIRELKWDQVFSRLLGRMSPAVRITRPGYPDIVKKGKIEPIEMAVAKRSGNKKVTLVYNVGHFGIVESEFARQIQHIAAASTCVGPAEHKPQGTTQVLVQGNATADVAKLLLETYNIPKKYIKGLELIPKAKRVHN